MQYLQNTICSQSELESAGYLAREFKTIVAPYWWNDHSTIKNGFVAFSTRYIICVEVIQWLKRHRAYDVVKKRTNVAIDRCPIVIMS